MNPHPAASRDAELLAPAGDWECVRAAVANGADAVYFGLPQFNARLRAENFTAQDLPEVVEYCHRRGVKAYVVLNTLVFTAELDAAAACLRLCSEHGVDALIVQDVGLVRLAREIVPDLPIHASTQMTITSPEGAEFAQALGVERVVLARELSLRELEKFDAHGLPLEVFVHGALCVAYSGQCLTSESLGRRSANRGECAQACRLPYELVVDGAVQDLGDRRYLLSPQDLAAVREIPALLERGVVSFKIEGRLKSPEYVAAVCQVYRKALDAALAERPFQPSAADEYQLEMTFSRGLFSGWLHGVNHQELVGARYGKKRGPYVGRVVSLGRDQVEVESQIPLAPGDGVVFDTGGDTNQEQGGRIYAVQGKRLSFEHGRIDFTKIKRGTRVWKTDDPALEKRLRSSFAGAVPARRRTPLDLAVSGRIGEPLTLRGEGISVASTIHLQAARSAPLTTERLREHLGKFGEAPWILRALENSLEGEVILPIGELNRVRREFLFALEKASQPQRASFQVDWRTLCPTGDTALTPPLALELSVLCRSLPQIEAALAAGVRLIYADFEDIRRYADVVAHVRRAPQTQIFLATPRIQKAGEQGFFRLIENAVPDGVLIRNVGAIAYFRDKPLRRRGDFSLNVANPIAAAYFLAQGLEAVTISYDLDFQQVLDLVQHAAADRLEITLHQHMPMFHMEHCVFAAFMSEGRSFLDCGRPCEKHQVHLRDRVGVEHPLRADVGCRNTLYNAVAQTGAQFFPRLAAAGLKTYRVELLEETEAETRQILLLYQSLLAGGAEPDRVWRQLKARSQLGVTHGTLV